MGATTFHPEVPGGVFMSETTRDQQRAELHKTI